jgi:hypothetical protein
VSGLPLSLAAQISCVPGGVSAIIDINSNLGPAIHAFQAVIQSDRVSVKMAFRGGIVQNCRIVPVRLAMWVFKEARPRHLIPDLKCDPPSESHLKESVRGDDFRVCPILHSARLKP